MPDDKMLDDAPVVLGDFMPEAVAARLRTFSKHANRAGLHPLDSERWYGFVIAAHRSRSSLTGDDLYRWLKQDRWPDEAAHRLLLAYEEARDLLKAYDDRGAPSA